jgi:hypothetical protein
MFKSKEFLNLRKYRVTVAKSRSAVDAWAYHLSIATANSRVSYPQFTNRVLTTNYQCELRLMLGHHGELGGGVFSSKELLQLVHAVPSRKLLKSFVSLSLG